MDEIVGDMNGDGLVNSADTGIVGDTNGDGVVDDADTGLVGDTNGESFVSLVTVSPAIFSCNEMLLHSSCG